MLAAVDHVIDIGLLDPSRIAVLGGSHGGFLVTHLIGQVPDKFALFYSKSPISCISKVWFHQLNLDLEKKASMICVLCYVTYL